MRVVSPDVALGLGPKWRETEIIGGRQVDKNVSEVEVRMIAALTKFVNPKIVMELGTANGRTTLNLAKHCAPRGHVYTIDLEVCGERIQDYPEYRDKITKLLGSTHEFDFQEFLGQCNFVFVDAGHRDIEVLKDSLLAIRLLAHDGVIVWHDYNPDDPPNQVWETIDFFSRYYPGLSPVWVEGSNLVVHRQGNLPCIDRASS